MKIAIILGSVRENRNGIKAARFAERITADRGWDNTLIDPEEWDLPLLKRMYKTMEDPDEKFEMLHNIFHESDGYLMVTAEYNHGVPPALKNILDHYQKEFYFKPSAIISYSVGSFGGVRATEQLRLICAELGMPSISSSLPIPRIKDNLSDDGTSKDGSFEKRSKKFLDEFEWYLEAFKSQREKGTPY